VITANAPAVLVRGALAGMLLAAVRCMAASAGQECDTSRYPLSTPEERFEDRGDGTLLDRQTQLLWLRCAVGQQWSGGQCSGQASLLSWPAALQQVQDLNSHGTWFFSDWRIPRIQELASIAERQCRNPRINLRLFPGTPAAPFWSATPRQPSGSDAALLMLGFGEEGVGHDDQEGRHFVRLVRTGP